MVAPALPLDPAVMDRWGLAFDREQGLLRVAPRLETGERAASVGPFRAGRSVLALELRRKAGTVALRVRVLFGPPIHIQAGLPGLAEPSGLVVDDVPLGGAMARFEARARHEVVWVE